MNCRIVSRGMLAGVVAAALLMLAVPASAQVGTVKGRVVDEAGKPVAGADIVFDYAGEMNLHFTGKSDNKGEFIRAGLMAVGGHWKITVKKGDLAGIAPDVDVPLSATANIPDIVIRKGGASAAGDKSGGSPEAKAKAELQKLMADVNTDMTASNYDGAITKLNEYVAKNDQCAPCYVRLGDAYAKKPDADNAEKSFLKAASIDEKSADAADAYNALANLYNAQRKFDDAAKMSQKAMALQSASGGATDPTAAFNAGVIFWNQSKIPEAKAQFQKALELKPDLAEAHYYVGMCLVNEGKLPEAKASLEKYLQLAPNGANAPIAKSIVDSMK